MEIFLRRYCEIYSFLLLVLIVEATDSSHNETLQERRQSRVTGRIVKLYSGTRPEPILCANEGFRADPHNCAVFYRCMKSGNGRYTVFRFQCGPGTVFDPETEVCNFPQSTKRSECGGMSLPPPVDRVSNNEIEGMQHEIPSPITNLPLFSNSPILSFTETASLASSTKLSSTTKRQIPESSVGLTSTSIGDNIYTASPLNLQNIKVTQQQYTQTPKTTSSSTIQVIPQSNSQDNVCTSDGFMGDSENCRKFYRCVATQKGSYVRYEFSCSETTIWDDDTQSCNHAWAVKRSRCGRSNQRITHQLAIPNKFPITNKENILQKVDSYDKTIQQQLQVSYGSKVTQTQTQISNGSVIQNQTQLNYGDRINPNKNSEVTQSQTQISNESAVSQTQIQIDFSNKGVQTQSQIDHSQQSSQTQVQIHESVKEVFTSTTQTTQSSNRCNKSGFMGDDDDCKKFYRCVDNGRGGFTKFEFSCGEGTVWDQSIEACNHAWAVKKCGSKGSAETASSTQPAVSTSKTTQNYFTTVSTENYHSSSEHVVTEDYEDSGYGNQNQQSTSTTIKPTSTTAGSTAIASSTTITSSINYDCQTSGFMGSKNDCKVFYRCVENGRGGFTKYEFKCGEGTVWDPDIDACNHAWAVERCGGSSSTDINKVETTTYSQTAPSTSYTQSTLVVTHSTSESSATQNDDYDTGYGSVNNDFTTATTTTSTTKQPQNENHNAGGKCQASGFMGDKNDCKKFYRCVDNGNGGYTRYEFTCGEGTVWDSKIEACNHAWAVETCGSSQIGQQETTIESILSTSSPDTGSSSISAPSDQNTYTPTHIPSTTSSSSTVTESVATSSNKCTHSGFMGDDKDCKKFYRCVDNGNGSFTKYEFSCGEGTVWDQKIDACNHAWAVEKCGGNVETSTYHQDTTTSYHPIMSDEIITGYPSNVETSSDITTQSTSTTTGSSKETSEDNKCINSGFIGNTNDCKKFYRCVDDGKGGFIRYEFSCGEGTLWDQSIEACNHAWAVEDCGKSGNNTMPTTSESTTEIILTSVTEDEGYPQHTDSISTSTAISHPENGISIPCTKEGFIGDNNNCKIIYRCVDNGRGGFTKYEFKCGEGTYWNQEILSCDHAALDSPCRRKENGSTTQIPQHEHDDMYSEASTMSSSSTAKNENEYTTQKPQISSGICTAEGFYGDQKDCKKFYRCVDNGKGGYTKYEFMCGDGTVWDSEIQACDHESSNVNCGSSTQSTSKPSESQSEHTESPVSTSTQSQHSSEETETSSTTTSKKCSSEGFFADPKDCKKFIRCVRNDKGGYTSYEFSCGEGTIWVQDLLACDHDTGDAVCSSQTTETPFTTEAHQQTTDKYKPDASTSESSNIDKQEDEYQTENSNKPSPTESGDCLSEGFHANKNDCRQFYRCVDNDKGGFTKYDFTCGEGTAWDDEVQTCNHIDQVKSCKGSSGTQPALQDEDNNQASESSSTIKTTTSESSPDTSSENKNTCNSEGYFGDTQDCKKFYRCVDTGKGGYTKYDFTCGDGTIWDQDITTCNHPQDVVNPTCNQNEDAGSTSTTASSSSSNGSSGDTTTTTETSGGASNCSQEETSKKPNNQNITCDKAGYYANPNDCKKFYRCVDWDGDGNRFSVYHFECGEGTIWDPAVETCNHEESVYPPRDCSSQSQSENQTPATEDTTTTQKESMTTQSTTSEQTTTEQTTTQQQSTTLEQNTQQSTTLEQTTTQQSTTSEGSSTPQSTSSEQTTTLQSTTSEPTTTSQATTSEQTTTEQSLTSEHTTTQKSTTPEQSTTQLSTTSEQTTTQQSTTSEQTTTEQSTTSEQTTIEQTTTSERTTTQESTTSEQTTTQQSTSSEQTTTEQSTSSEQTATQQSTPSEQSTTQETTTSEQITQDSTTSESTTEKSSTTEQSTTQESTTEQSTTHDSTTSTTDSTTQQSTTEQTDENSTTESSTNGSSTDKCPETEEDQNLFVCPTSFRRHPKYCNLFYQCDEDDDTHDVKIAVFTCPNNTIYDENQTRCVEESKADKKCDGEKAQKRRFKRLNKDYKEPIVVTKDSQACPSAGYFSFEKDSECSPAFLKCKTDKTKKLRGLVYQCPTGYVYWSISKRCEPINRVRDCKRSHNNWTGRWEIPVERRNVAPL